MAVGLQGAWSSFRALPPVKSSSFFPMEPLSSHFSCLVLIYLLLLAFSTPTPRGFSVTHLPGFNIFSVFSRLRLGGQTTGVWTQQADHPRPPSPFCLVFSSSTILHICDQRKANKQIETETECWPSTEDIWEACRKIYMLVGFQVTYFALLGNEPHSFLSCFILPHPLFIV